MSGFGDYNEKKFVQKSYLFLNSIPQVVPVVWDGENWQRGDEKGGHFWAVCGNHNMEIYGHFVGDVAFMTWMYCQFKVGCGDYDMELYCQFVGRYTVICEGCTHYDMHTQTKQGRIKQELQSLV